MVILDKLISDITKLVAKLFFKSRCLYFCLSFLNTVKFASSKPPTRLDRIPTIGAGALYGKMLLIRNIENNKINT